LKKIRRNYAHVKANSVINRLWLKKKPANLRSDQPAYNV